MQLLGCPEGFGMTWAALVLVTQALSLTIPNSGLPLLPSLGVVPSQFLIFIYELAESWMTKQAHSKNIFILISTLFWTCQPYWSFLWTVMSINEILWAFCWGHCRMINLFFQAQSAGRFRAVLPMGRDGIFFPPVGKICLFSLLCSFPPFPVSGAEVGAGELFCVKSMSEKDTEWPNGEVRKVTQKAEQ